MALIIISRCDFTISDLDLCVAGCEIVVSYPKICLISNIMSPFSSSGNSEGVAAGCVLYPHLATCVLLNYSNLCFHPHHHALTYSNTYLNPHHQPHTYTYPQLHPHHHPHAYTYLQLHPHHHLHAYTTPHGGIGVPYSCKNGDEKKWGK